MKRIRLHNKPLVEIHGADNERMRVLLRIGPRRSITLMTVLTMVLAILCRWILGFFEDGPVSFHSYLITVGVVVIVTPLCTYFFLTLLYQLEESRILARQLSQTDDLTQLFNRRYFMEEARHELQLAEVNGRVFSVVLLDIDHFKSINDTKGHLAGDAALRQLGLMLMSNCRKEQIIARFGGEEIVVLLPNTPLRTASLVAERLRKAIANLTITTPEENFSITASAGVAVWHPGDTLELILARVDEALYAAKAAGRNQVMIADGEGIHPYYDDPFTQN